MNASLPTEERPAAGTGTAVIEMNDVSVGVAGIVETVSVEGIEYCVAAGDYWVIGGPPGSGKTDLLATLAGLYRPLKGTLRLFGNDVAQLGEEDFLAARLRIGLVFENGGRLFNHLSVAENVALPLSYHHEDRPAAIEERVKRILEATDLALLADRPPGEIKHAWRQRAGLARALALGPEILLLDNPLAGLGASESRWWREFLLQLSAGSELMGGRPVTLVVAAQDLRPWADHGRQFGLLEQKRWLRIGGRAELAVCDEPLLRDLLGSNYNLGRPGAC